MKTRLFTWFIGAAVIALSFQSCNKEAISPNKLKGNTWNVVEWYILTGHGPNNGGTNYATWKNTGDAFRIDQDGEQGSWDITKDGEVTIDITYDAFNNFTGQTQQVEWKWEGTLDMNDRQDFFGLENEYDYKQYHIHEKKGNTITIYWEDLWNGSERGDIHFLTLEK